MTAIVAARTKSTQNPIDRPVALGQPKTLHCRRKCVYTLLSRTDAQTRAAVIATLPEASISLQTIAFTIPCHIGNPHRWEEKAPRYPLAYVSLFFATTFCLTWGLHQDSSQHRLPYYGLPFPGDGALTRSTASPRMLQSAPKNCAATYATRAMAECQMTRVCFRLSEWPKRRPRAPAAAT